MEGEGSPKGIKRGKLWKFMKNFEAVACTSQAQWDVTSFTFPTSRCSDILSVRDRIVSTEKAVWSSFNLLGNVGTWLKAA